MAKLEETAPAEVDVFKGNMNKVMKELLGRFKDLQFFTGETISIYIYIWKWNLICLHILTGENMDVDGMVALMEYRDIGGESRPVMMFFKHGLIAEKF